jgi:hypothetical protein
LITNGSGEASGTNEAADNTPDLNDIAKDVFDSTNAEAAVAEATASEAAASEAAASEAATEVEGEAAAATDNGLNMSSEEQER